jgi:hypothetical protein
MSEEEEGLEPWKMSKGLEGYLAFEKDQQKYVEEVIGVANTLSKMSSTRMHKLEFLIALMGAVTKGHKDENELVNQKVYDFLMSWLAGATHFAADTRIALSHGIAFAAGAAAVGTALFIGGMW